ncbi:M23 family metallopeptidase [Scandinavium sp. V105_16]|uniref:M23 family metallopeptidase n=1 Tax=Scandinavium lactucae TaxID=3095028 RepID=A0AAJ2VU36_9ENTR|nr:MULTISPECIES: M23 family metallopeptidase [unclassified Scandinavium]MDX6019660.1 M23 family metallopeptidase [Scandinavium sp. V105_16]MDX6032681.1 M23 family metallopeptidase [Scandinavium sp. V105_12]
MSPLTGSASNQAGFTLALVSIGQLSVVTTEEIFTPALLMREKEKTPLLAQMAGTTYPRFLAPLAIPLRVTSSFRFRYHPVTHRFAQHEGTDYAAPRLTPVLASEQGIVVEADTHPFAGNYVVLQHPGGWRSRYLHLDKIIVTMGQKVARGNLIALSGNTGRTTGPHLHFELSWRGHLVNGEKYLSSSAHYANLHSVQAIARAPKPAVPKVIMIAEIAGKKKVIIKYQGKTIFASPNQTVFGNYKVVMQSGRYRLQNMTPTG